MPLSVIGAGFGRTGTMSLKLALERLGMGRCHHMEEVLASPDQARLWDAASRGEAVDWDEVFADFGCAVDWPSAHWWRELADRYPEAKVVLTTRPADGWWDSFSETIARILAMTEDVEDPHPRAVLRMARRIVEDQTLDGRMQDRDAAIAAFERRRADVEAAIPADRLLVFDVRDGWAPLCAFLGAPAPEEPFPRTNDVKEFWSHFSPDESSPDESAA